MPPSPEAPGPTSSLPSTLERIRIVLVRPRSPGNVGSAARAMRNFGLSRLVLAELPEFRDPEFFPVESRKMAWKAAPLLDRCTRTEDLATALRGTTLAFGTAPRTLAGFPALTPREGARQLVEAAGSGTEVALVFGGEADGLRNHEHAQVNGLVRIPTSEDYSDLNLAQSVGVCCYELFTAHLEARGRAPLPVEQEAAASHEEVQAFLQAAQEILEGIGFLQGSRPALVDELRRVAGRARFRSRELQIFRGMLRQLNWARHQRK